MRWASLHCFLLSLSSGYCRPPIPYAPPGMQNDLARGTRGTAICMLASSSSSAPSHPFLPRSRYYPPPPLQGHCFDPAHSMLGPLDRPSTEPPPLPCPPDIVLLLGKRCQRGLSSFSLFHNLPKGETEKEEKLGHRIPSMPATPLPFPSLFLLYFTQCHCVTGTSSVARGGSFRCPTFYSFPLSKH